MEEKDFGRTLATMVPDPDQGWFLAACASRRTRRCPDQKETVMRLWREADDPEGFLELIRGADADFRVGSDFYGELAATLGWEVPVMEDMVVAKGSFTAESGSIRIDSLDGSFSSCFRSGGGGGSYEVVAVESPSYAKPAFNRRMARLVGAAGGAFAVMDRDSPGAQPLFELEGHYDVHVVDGGFILEKAW